MNAKDTGTLQIFITIMIIIIMQQSECSHAYKLIQLYRVACIKPICYDQFVLNSLKLNIKPIKYKTDKIDKIFISAQEKSRCLDSRCLSSSSLSIYITT